MGKRKSSKKRPQKKKSGLMEKKNPGLMNMRSTDWE